MPATVRTLNDGDDGNCCDYDHGDDGSDDNHGDDDNDDRGRRR